MTGAETEPLSLTLDFYPNPDHAGIYMAQKLGYFDDAGLDVSIQTPSDPAAPIKLVAAGQTDLAISYEPEVLLAREQGLDVVAVGAVVDRPLTSMIWLKKSGIKGRRRPARQDDRHRRHPLPGRLPEDDPRPRQAVPRRRQDRQRRLRPAAGAGRRPRAGDAGRLQQRRGRRPAPARQGPGRHPGRPARRADLRRARPGRPAQAARRRPGGDPPLPRRAGARHRRGGQEPRARRPRRCSKPTPTSTRS